MDAGTGYGGDPVDRVRACLGVEIESRFEAILAELRCASSRSTSPEGGLAGSAATVTSAPAGESTTDADICPSLTIGSGAADDDLGCDSRSYSGSYSNDASDGDSDGDSATGPDESPDPQPWNLPVGAALAAAMQELSLESVDAFDVGQAVAGWERLIAWAQAGRAAAVAELAGREEMNPPGSDEFSSLSPVAVTGGELCTVWPHTKPQAQRIADDSVQLTEVFPSVHRALSEGRIDERRAKTFIEILRGHDQHIIDQVVEAVLPLVDGWTSVKLSRALRQLLHRFAPDETRDRHERAKKQRRVWTEPAADGMAWLHAYVTAEDAAAVMTALTAAAGAEPAAGVAAGVEERRADALVSAAWEALRTGQLAGTPLATKHNRPVTVNVTVDLSTLIGLDECPAELEGYGPIDADTARRLAAAGVWRWVGTDPVGGWALDYGRTRYVPPQDLVDYVILRDRECVMPGCHQSAHRCEIDHRDPFPGGPTSACNCMALCKGCHIQKHRAGWTVEQCAPGAQRWTSPTGRVHTVRLDDWS